MLCNSCGKDITEQSRRTNVVSDNPKGPFYCNNTCYYAKHQDRKGEFDSCSRCLIHKEELPCKTCRDESKVFKVWNAERGWHEEVRRLRNVPRQEVQRTEEVQASFAERRAQHRQL